MYPTDTAYCSIVISKQIENDCSSVIIHHRSNRCCLPNHIKPHRSPLRTAAASSSYQRRSYTAYSSIIIYQRRSMPPTVSTSNSTPAAHSSIITSTPIHTADTNTIIPTRLLDSFRTVPTFLGDKVTWNYCSVGYLFFSGQKANFIFTPRGPRR